MLIRAVLVSLVALAAACGGGEGSAPCGGYVSAEQVRELADVPAVDVTTSGSGSCEYRYKSSLLLSVEVIEFDGGGAGLLPRAVPPEYTRVPAEADAFISAGAFPDALVVVDDHTMLRIVPPRTPQQVSGPPLEALVRAVANAV